MKKLNNRAYLLALFLMASNLIYADLGTDIMLNSKLDELNAGMDRYETEQSRQKNIALEARLLINSSEVILECIKNRDGVMLKSVYDKMRADVLFKRPTNEQIEEYLKMVQEYMSKAKVDKIAAQQSRAGLKKFIINSVTLGASIIAFGGLFAWGHKKMQNAVDLDLERGAKYATDGAAIVGLPLTSLLLVKLLLDLFPSQEIQNLKKINGLLLLFEKLSITT